jgi:flagellar biosynthesis component FlhA
MNKIVAVFLGISILVNVILALMFVGQRATVSQVEEKTEESKKQLVQLKNESHKKEKALTAFQQNQSYYEIEHSEEVKRFVDETFKELFNYDNKTYAARFDQVRNKLAESVISKLKASGEMGSTQIEFSNKVMALNVYLSAIEKDQAKALVNMETQYSVGSSEFPRKNQIYEVTLVRNKDQWLLDKLELMGSFEPFEAN